MIITIKKNILNASEDYIAHQCNCVTHNAAGVAAQIFQKWSYADCYATRWEQDTPGTITMGLGEKNIINMFAQVYPGPPKDPNDPIDGFTARKKYFIQCLKQIADMIPQKSRIAFPAGIGCGLAQGDPKFYEAALNKFAINFDVTLYQI